MGKRSTQTELPLDPETIPGFLSPEEGWALHVLALEAAVHGPCIEIGSYCGKSTLYLGAACKARAATLYSVDHHRGSEEHQLGEAYHDPLLYDLKAGHVDTFPTFRRTLRLAALEETVVPIVSAYAVFARDWKTPLGLVFIDGGHSEASANADYDGWAKHVASGGILAVHDVFLDPSAGGQAPRAIWRRAVEEGDFTAVEIVGSLGVLKRR
jgi:predicted O-methyltransferase YrrM